MFNGIITFNNGSEIDEQVITELSDNRLVFNLRIDADFDGELDLFPAICNRYEPPNEIDIYTSTFNRDYAIPNNDKLLLKWQAYKGYNIFDKYEIYRLNEGCNVLDAQLITTITDENTSFFIDETPPAYE